MLWIKDSFLRAKYSLAHFLKITTMHGLSERLHKEDFLLWDQNMQTERACLVHAWAPVVEFIINFKQEHRWCWYCKSSSVLRVSISSGNCCLINFQNAARKKYYSISAVVDNKNVGQSCGNPVSMVIHIGHVTCFMIFSHWHNTLSSYNNIFMNICMLHLSFNVIDAYILTLCWCTNISICEDQK